MTRDEFSGELDVKASELGVKLDPSPRGKLAKCVTNGSLVFTSGQTSKLVGILGDDLDVKQGYAAARDCMRQILANVQKEIGTLERVRPVRLLGAVRSRPEFVEQHLVMHGATDLLLELYGEEEGIHARSALGFASLPGGAAVEVEAIFALMEDGITGS